MPRKRSPTSSMECSDVMRRMALILARRIDLPARILWRSCRFGFQSGCASSPPSFLRSPRASHASNRHTRPCWKPSTTCSQCRPRRAGQRSASIRASIEIGHLWGITGFNQCLKTRLNQRCGPAAKHCLLTKQIGFGFFTECGFNHPCTTAAIR